MSLPTINSTSGIQFKSQLGVAVVLIMLGVAEYLGLEQYVRAPSEQLLRPFLIGGRAAVTLVEAPFVMIQHARRADRTIRELETKYAQTLAELSQLEGVKAENEALRSLLQDTDRTADQTLIARPIFSRSRSAIDAGAQQGIEEGMAVMVEQTVVGLVTETSPQFSLVTLLSELTQHSIVAMTESGHRGLIKGDRREVLFTEVPHEAEIILGEKVVTLGQPGVQRDLFIGTILREVKKPESPTKTYIIEQPVSFAEARVAEVLVPSL